jgi:hypothetical protein
MRRFDRTHYVAVLNGYRFHPQRSHRSGRVIQTRTRALRRFTAVGYVVAASSFRRSTLVVANVTSARSWHGGFLSDCGLVRTVAAAGDCSIRIFAAATA